MSKLILRPGDTLSAEGRAQLRNLPKGEPDTSDIPEASPEELKLMARLVREKRKKKMFTLRLNIETIGWWQKLGEGYTGIMSRLLEEAKTHPEWIKECLPLR
jgi:uncharacterized protein (DUF4415 family)